LPRLQDLMNKVWSASAASFMDMCTKAERRIRANNARHKAYHWHVVAHSRGLVQELSGDVLAALANRIGRIVTQERDPKLERVWGYRACEPIMDDVRLSELFNKVRGNFHLAACGLCSSSSGMSHSTRMR